MFHSWGDVPLSYFLLTEHLTSSKEVEDDEGDLGVAEHGELVRLLEKSVVTLAEGDLPSAVVL
jgi:hypothetical protein